MLVSFAFVVFVWCEEGLFADLDGVVWCRVGEGKGHEQFLVSSEGERRASQVRRDVRPPPPIPSHPIPHPLNPN